MIRYGRPKRKFRFMRYRYLLAVLLPMCAYSPATADTILSTLPLWDGSSTVCCFPETPTIGQTITVPSSDSILESFSFELNLPSQLTFAGYVYAWDNSPANLDGTGGQVATGPRLFQSAPVTIGGTGGFELVTIDTGGLPLLANQEYVLFISTSEFGGPSGGGQIGAQPYFTPDWYSGGMFVFNNDNDSTHWTTPRPGSGWVPYFIPNNGDLAFQAQFTSVPEPSAASSAFGVLCAFCLANKWRSLRLSKMPVKKT